MSEKWEPTSEQLREIGDAVGSARVAEKDLATAGDMLAGSVVPVAVRLFALVQLVNHPDDRVVAVPEHAHAQHDAGVAVAVVDADELLTEA